MKRIAFFPRRLACLVGLVGLCLSGSLITAGAVEAPGISPELRKKVDHLVKDALASADVPSLTLAIVKDGQVAYLQAYGEASLSPQVAAKPAMRYCIGSVSKQFTAAVVLMLAEEGKLSLDDSVAKYLPGLTRAKEITIRQVLSHTSGYQDYWPQDYVPPFMLQQVTPMQILERWAGKPLDFEPGAEYQYSNTGFVIAGLIAEKASGQPLWTLLDERIFKPLGMRSVRNIDQELLGQEDSVGYTRYALGPHHPAPKEGKGWLFAAGGIAMTAEDLAKWDISIIRESLFKAGFYREFEREALLNNGIGARYALGVTVGKVAGHHAVAHNGEVSGFCARNLVFPEDKIAICAMVNQDASGAVTVVVDQIAALLLAPPPAEAAKLNRDREVLKELQKGKLDRALFTNNALSYFSDQARLDIENSLKPLGTLKSFSLTTQNDRGGMHFRAYRAVFAKKTVTVLLRELPDGMIEQYQIDAGN